MIILFVILSLYCLLILWFAYGFYKLKMSRNEIFPVPQTRFSIVIPFRNESSNLPSLLDSLKTLDYPAPMFEIIMIDDDSTDNSTQIIRDFSATTTLNISVIRNIRSSTSPKKDAIETAISRAKNEWIVTTDADCILPANWLWIFDSAIGTNGPKFIAGPVTYMVEDRFSDHFQLLDFQSLQAITMGAFGWKKAFLCNGANLAYEKKAFVEVMGFIGNDIIASGDDIFLLEKMQKHYPDKVVYLKNRDLIVKTRPQNGWNALVQQRIRWAAKTSAYKNPMGKWIGSLVLLMNISLIVLLIISLISASYWGYFLISFAVKFFIDLLLLAYAAFFFQQKEQLKNYPLSSVVYPFFCVYVALSSFKKGYVWKGRNFER
ncbi:glycosyltransferase [Leptobacterium flavescens]|uniref:Glycosyltransferase n=2 Tax=Leptobacterium flavescens TaxID=472055 RepID=A0A6P0UPE6_9FLAO|nr:glycosyltransferase [Leptobacterium flavescens]